MSFDISKYREMFLEEAEELFESADNVLLEAESNGNLTDDEMGQLFRDVHTLKGSGASVELALFAKFTHNVENFMDKLRNHELKFIPKMASTLIDAMDVMKELLDLEVSDSLEEENYSQMTEELIEEINSYQKANDDEVTNDDKEALIKQNTTLESNKEEEKTEIVNLENEKNDNFGFFESDITPENDRSDSFGFFADDENAINDEKYGFFNEEMIETSKNYTEEPVIDKNKEDFGFFDEAEEITPNSVIKVDKIVEENPASNNEVEKNQNSKQTEVKKSTPVVKKSLKTVEKPVVKKVSTTNNNIRVNLDKIDLLMNNVGELVITNAMLTQFSSTIEENRIRNSVLERLELLERHIRDMQDSIMSIRMVPMESIYSKFPKVVRDISKKLGKKVDFKHYGDAVEIDKAMIEGLTDPLMHIIRNSLDHGIETPEERSLTSKPESGSISISAEQANGQMIISVSDDGKGIDAEVVARKVYEQGQISETQYNSMDDNEKAMLIFGAGVSTADKVTDISGRGVGMDVVKTNIQKLGGTIKLDTTKGLGTTITIMLPLTLAILDGLDIKVGSQKYILPLSSIIESLQPTSEMIKKIGDGSQELLMLREEFIPVIRLHELFGLKKTFEKLEDGMLIVVKSGTTKIALSIDEFQDQHQVVVKPLDKNFRSVEGIGAATVKGDGSIGLILDVIGIINAQTKKEKDSKEFKRAS